MLLSRSVRVESEPLYLGRESLIIARIIEGSAESPTIQRSGPIDSLVRGTINRLQFGFFEKKKKRTNFCWSNDSDSIRPECTAEAKQLEIDRPDDVCVCSAQR